MDLETLKNRIIGETLVIAEENGSFISHVIAEVKEIEDGKSYVLYSNERSAGFSFTKAQTEQLALRNFVREDDVKYHIKTTGISQGLRKKAIDWEERTWQATLAILASKDMAIDLETAVNTARAIVMIYRLTPEIKEEKK